LANQSQNPVAAAAGHASFGAIPWRLIFIFIVVRAEEQYDFCIIPYYRTPSSPLPSTESVIIYSHIFLLFVVATFLFYLRWLVGWLAGWLDESWLVSVVWPSKFFSRHHTPPSTIEITLKLII
jgi:hypothetical protein